KERLTAQCQGPKLVAELTMKDDIAGLSPNQLVRLRDGEKYFGYKPTQRDKKIKQGLIPRPMRFSPGGRAVGWTGAQIIEHHRQLRELAAAEAATAEQKHNA